MQATTTRQPAARKSTMDRIREGLAAIGAAFAGSDAKVYDREHQKEFYHIHPDRRNPYQDQIIKMASQREILSYIQAIKKASEHNEAVANRPSAALLSAEYNSDTGLWETYWQERAARPY